MNLLLMGGWMMWPLTLVSVTVTAIIIERLLLFSSFRFPSRRMTELLEKVVQGDSTPLFAELDKVEALRRFSSLLAAEGPGREAALRIEGDAVVRKLEARLALLSILARLAPLMGLLGTVLGMIETFSEIADAQAGVNMNQLAGGIWQALITTATGLFIAIPALFFLHYFQTRADEAASALSETANAVLAADGEAQ
ncbi:MotA/TolQ/ExbB proton channel family protein [uncultured Mailhella sp.]|uniref:MotA/TolQ/ExbB proton channel family protein n=1 Tax=uncultured Mailhella sp. TaxID=1981031 RepID=UPI0026015EC8|nr:MotA/TolQ/ExbB proton channel family protein [uncultured Mailhella sp.]